MLTTNKNYWVGSTEAETDDYLLLEDNSSKFLLEDDTDALIMEG